MDVSKKTIELDIYKPSHERVWEVIKPLRSWDDERWIIILEFSRKKYINYYYLSQVEPTSTQTQLI
jgi:hypothetical protein